MGALVMEHWNIENHVIRGAFVRGLDRGVRNNDDSRVRLSVNHYTLKRPVKDKTGLITIVAAHGLGHSKETFEPFFDDLAACNAPVCDIWFCDAAQNAKSFTLNRDVIGDETHWLDYARDMFQMINHFQDAMSVPLVGLAHSRGVGNMSVLSSWHPRLFSGLILMEPGLGPNRNLRWPPPVKAYPGIAATRRRDKWPSLDEARERFMKNPYYAPFESRALDRVLKYDLREMTPEEASKYPQARPGSTPVTLTTPRHIESYDWMAASPPFPHHLPHPDANNADDDGAVFPGFHRPDAIPIQASIALILPPTLFVWGGTSRISPESRRQWFRSVAGTGRGGNGGVATGSVQEVEVPNASHQAHLEKPRETAQALLPWLWELKGKLEEQKERKKLQLPFIDDVPPEWLERISKL